MKEINRARKELEEFEEELEHEIEEEEENEDETEEEQEEEEIETKPKKQKRKKKIQSEEDIEALQDIIEEISIYLTRDYHITATYQDIIENAVLTLYLELQQEHKIFE